MDNEQTLLGYVSQIVENYGADVAKQLIANECEAFDAAGLAKFAAAQAYYKGQLDAAKAIHDKLYEIATGASAE